MKTKAYLILFSLMLCCICIQGTFSGDKIRLKLHQPPPGKMPVTNLWKLDIENTTRESIRVYLYGTATEDKSGKIAEGKSKAFSVKPGKKTYGYDDFKSGDFKWINKKYEESIIRTGSLPPGEYTYCVTAYYEDGTLADQEQCVSGEVKNEGVISLISPSDGEEFKPETPINFMWVGTGLKGPYSLKIVELIKNQLPEEAMNKNGAFFEKENINSTNIQLPVDKKLEAGKKYAWGVSSAGASSNVQMLIVVGGSSVTLSLTPTTGCNGTCCCYKITVSSTATLPLWNAFMIDMYDGNPLNHNPTPHLPFPFVTSTNPVVNVGTSPSSYPSEYSVWKTTNNQGFNIPSQDVGDICFANGNGNPYDIRIFWSSDFGNTWYTTDFDTHTINPSADCNTPCISAPGGMVDWWTFDETTGTNSDDRAGTNNNGTHVNSPVFITGMVAGALRFSQNNYVEVPNHAEVNFGPCEDFTIDAWVRTSSIGAVLTIVDKRESGCSSLGYSMYLFQGRIGIQIGKGSSYDNYNAPNSAAQLNDGNWHLVAVTYNRAASILTLYQDNTVVATVSSLAIPNLNNSAPLVIGTRHPNFGLSSFNGDIDELEIFKRALTQTEIQSIHDALSAGKCK